MIDAKSEHGFDHVSLPSILISSIEFFVAIKKQDNFVSIWCDKGHLLSITTELEVRCHLTTKLTQPRCAVDAAHRLISGSCPVIHLS